MICPHCKREVFQTVCKDPKCDTEHLPLEPMAATEQPAPSAGEGPEIGPLVLDDIRARIELGKKRYGTALRAYNGRSALVDAIQEAIDLVMYLRQLQVQDDATRQEVRHEEAAFAYVGGFFDGEGHVALKGHLSLQTVNTDEEVLRWMQTTTGVGKVYSRKVQPSRKPTFVWHVNAEEGAWLLSRLLPYLHTKREAAEEFLRRRKR